MLHHSSLHQNYLFFWLSTLILFNKIFSKCKTSPAFQRLTLSPPSGHQVISSALKMGTASVPEMTEKFCTLTRLSAREDFIWFCRRESFKMFENIPSSSKWFLPSRSPEYIFFLLASPWGKLQKCYPLWCGQTRATAFWWGLTITQLPFLQVFSPSCQFLTLTSNIPLSTQFSDLIKVDRITAFVQRPQNSSPAVIPP